MFLAILPPIAAIFVPVISLLISDGNGAQAHLNVRWYVIVGCASLLVAIVTVGLILIVLNYQVEYQRLTWSVRRSKVSSEPNCSLESRWL
jgi:hypothetical protein